MSRSRGLINDIPTVGELGDMVEPPAQENVA